LIFAGCDENISDVQVFSIDTLVSFSVRESDKYTLSLQLTDKQLQQSSIICNSNKILIWNRNDFSPRQLSETTVDYSCMIHELDSGRRVNQTLNLFDLNKSKGFPSSLCYDARNNMIWGYDDQNHRIFRWRNIGIVPHFNPVRPEKDKKLILSISPTFRLDALRIVPPESLDSKAEAAILLCHLDRLSTQYGPPLHSAAESYMQDEIEILSSSTPDDCYCKFIVRGQIIVGCDLGLNILLIRDGEIASDIYNFPIHLETSNDHATEKFASFVEHLDSNCIVLICTMGGEAFKDENFKVKNGLRLLGANEAVKDLSTGGAFCMIGQKGSDPRVTPQSIFTK
jgi:hypothetical protein